MIFNILLGNMYDRNRPLDDYEVGEAAVLSLEEERTVVRADFTGTFTPEWDETILIALAVRQLNPYYLSTPYEFATFGISLTDLEDDTLMDLSVFEDDGLFVEHMVLSQLQEHINQVVEELREFIDDQPIPEGRYEGRSMFEVMEASTMQDMRDFMLFIIDNPVAYMGKTWKASELYATWLINGTPETESPRPLDGRATAGIEITEPATAGYPKIDRISRAYYGMLNDALLPGALLLSVNGTSAYNMNASQIRRQLQGDPFDMVSMTALTVDNAIYELEIALLPLPDEAGWLTQEPEDYRPQLFPIRNEDHLWGFMDSFGEEVIEPQYEDVVSELTNIPFAEGLEGVKVGDEWGFINLEGDMVIAPRWKKVDDFHGGFAGFQHPEDFRIGIIGGRTGYIDKTGREIIGAIYDKPFFTAGFSEGLCGVKKDDLIGYIDESGELVIPFQFTLGADFSDGLAQVQLEKKGKYGYIDKDGDWVIQPQYEIANPFYGGQTIVAESKDGTYKTIDTAGNTLFTFDMTPQANIFSETRVSDDRIRGRVGDKYGFMDGRGKVVIPAKYVDTAIFFSEGLIGVTESGVDPENELLWEKEGGWYFIDIDGNTVIEGPFEKVSRFSEGVCWVKPRGGLWGLIDREGDWLIEPEIDGVALPFEYDMARIVVRREEGGMFPESYNMYLRKEGYAVWRPFY